MTDSPEIDTNEMKEESFDSVIETVDSQKREEVPDQNAEPNEDEFDEFIEAVEDDDSDFGDFGDFEQGGAAETITSNAVLVDDKTFDDIESLKNRLNDIMDEIFEVKTVSKQPNQHILDDRSSEIFQQLSQIPHLKPNNWIKAHIRHNLLIKLGIPINLDELIDEKHTANQEQALSQRRKSINEEDIDWHEFDIPELGSLNLSSDKIVSLVEATPEILSKIETDNLNNTSESYLHSVTDKQKLVEKYKQLEANHQQLVQLSSIWKHEFEEHKKNFNIYESVVQNLIGYSQKLEREEILANIEKMKKKGKKKTTWK